ncbi:hypothetical protein JXA85_01995 [Candidatus Woesearchaeota archaeon]|nr:hypothetical protein [Candidatus Woesearchaeota archaeon]
MNNVNVCIEFPVQLNIVIRNNSARYGHIDKRGFIGLAEGAKNVSVSENGILHDSRFLFFR